MKPSYYLKLIAAALAAAVSASAQDTGYFTNADNPTIAQLASYYQIVVHTDSGWTFTDRWMNNQLKITGRISEDMKKRLGTFTYYDTAGVVVMRRKYVGNGGAIETRYYPDGHLMVQGPTLNEEKAGIWTSYYSSGKIKATASYTDGHVDTASFFSEDGSPDPTLNVFWQEAGYPGGDRAWLAFLNRNLRYPDGAEDGETRKTVIVQFLVPKDGKPGDFHVIKSAGKAFDAEAIRVMKKSGNWQPAIYGGIAVDTYKTQPVIFEHFEQF